jgi:surfactin family lipopeptide synthetase A
MECDRTERNRPQGKCIHQLFEEQAGRTPDAVAVEFEGDSLTYRELNARSGRMAHHLRLLGIGPEVLVGICLERLLDIAVALLAVLKTGGVLVPIEPDLPRARLEFIMADTQMPWLLTQSSLLDKLPPTNAKKLCLDQELPSFPASTTHAVPGPEVKPCNLAYAIYTSGSTGRPKGVLITQEAYLNYYGAAIKYWQYKAADRVLQFARFSFDVGIDQLLTPLLAGATVVLRGTEIWDPALFTKVIEERRLSVVHLPPSYWQKWVETLSQDAVGKVTGNLRLVQVGGDVMPMATVRRWRELKWRSVRLFNRYGPTETTMFSTAYEIPADMPGDDNALRIPIGRPVGNRTIYILDARGQPVPTGVTGEIHIGGGMLARGYLNRPELTAERFVQDPFNGKTGARLYKTGDLGRYLPDGNIDFLGRADFQVKIRGHRIELGEIEAVLGGHSAVSSCVVEAREGDGDKFLVAFMTGRTELSPATLRRWLGERLPDYMIPARFVAVPSLPLTPNGKVDRKALEKIDVEELAASASYTGPRNECECELAEIWQAVLRRERVGIHDNFFELGGHSLLATQVVSRLQQRFGVDVALRTVFESPTVAELEQRIEQKLQEEIGQLSEEEAASLLAKMQGSVEE